ncbi:substrate-binding domain-containing protein [Streptomyces oceani]|uniref:Periplasmic binding protein domain-containing protein n=1 Tax=Streptomyces oceani TaxID=1075402 RepID=A0A1E7KM03_9ACTN|nr:substrate-binding domain-containing protein [Streptomyces oceani]OEV04940.1 hypothetical protein AN216_04795 [Streptomyces oceani]
MRRATRGYAALGLVLTLAVTAGCTSKAPTNEDAGDRNKDEFVIGYSQSNNAEPYRAQINLQLRYYMEKYPKLKLLPISDGQQSSATQLSQVQTFIEKGVDVLLVSPNEPDPLTPVVEMACEARIPVVLLDRSVNTDCHTSFIGGDNYEIGKKAGERAVRELPDGGRVAELRGVLSAKPQIERHKGFMDAIKGHDIKVVAQREAKWLRADATKVTQQWLQGGKKIDLIFSHNDPMALGAFLAAKSAGKAKKTKFLGIDGLAIPSGGIRAVQQGKLDATYLYPTGAKEAARTVADIVAGRKVPKKQTLETVEINSENAAEIYQKYDMSGKIE